MVKYVIKPADHSDEIVFFKLKMLKDGSVALIAHHDGGPEQTIVEITATKCLRLNGGIPDSFGLKLNDHKQIVLL